MSEIVNNITQNEMAILAATISTVMGAIAGGVSTWLVGKTPKKDAEIEVVNVVVRDDPTGPCAVDLYFRNVGEKVAVVSGIDINVMDVWPLHTVRAENQLLEPSGHVQVTLDPERRGPYELQEVVNVEVRPHEADCIRVVFSGLPGKPTRETLYRIALTIRYNRNRTTEPEFIGLALPDLTGARPYFDWQFEMAILESKELAKGGKRSAEVSERMVKSLERSKDEIDGMNRQAVQMIRTRVDESRRNQRMKALILEFLGYSLFPSVDGAYRTIFPITSILAEAVVIKVVDKYEEIPNYKIPKRARKENTKLDVLYRMLGAPPDEKFVVIATREAEPPLWVGNLR